MPHNGLVDERFTESFALQDVLECGCEGYASSARGANADSEAFVVKAGSC